MGQGKEGAGTARVRDAAAAGEVRGAAGGRREGDVMLGGTEGGRMQEGFELGLHRRDVAARGLSRHDVGLTRHFQELRSLYGHVVVLNLVEGMCWMAQLTARVLAADAPVTHISNHLHFAFTTPCDCVGRSWCRSSTGEPFQEDVLTLSAQSQTGRSECGR